MNTTTQNRPIDPTVLVTLSLEEQKEALMEHVMESKPDQVVMATLKKLAEVCDLLDEVTPKFSLIVAKEWDDSDLMADTNRTKKVLERYHAQQH